MNSVRFFVAALLIVLVCFSATVKSQEINRRFEVYSVEHIAPDEIQRMLTDLLKDKPDEIRVISDQKKREVIISGDEGVHRLASQLIQQVDQPAVRAEADESSVRLKAYQIPAMELERCFLLFQRQLGNTARITVDRTSNQIVVATAEDGHRLVQQTLESNSENEKRLVNREADFANQREVTMNAELRLRQPTNRTDDKNRSIQYPLRNISTSQCQHAFGRVLNNKLRDLGSGQFRYIVPQTGVVHITFDSSRQVCELRGDQILIDQFLTLLDRFEASQAHGVDETFRFVPLEKIPPNVLRRAIQLWQDSSVPADLNENSMREVQPSEILPVAFIQGGESSQGSPDGQENAENPEMRRPSSNVEIQALPDLDVLILHGRDPDVDELLNIIQEIERLSEETTPEVELYHLKHVQDQSLNTLITQVLSDLTGPLQGRVSITPLVKPNALLLIGWGEAVEAAKKLIWKLDQPVHSDKQIKVFALKFASSQEVTETILQFLNGRGGLGPEVNVTSNPRTNGVIVNASPRDLEDVEKLIKTLDVPASESVNQAKMIRLKNSLASDVSTTISAAIEAARGGTGGRRSAALELLLVLPNGKEIVTSGILDSVTLTPDVRTNSIFITGPAESIPLVEKLIEQLDESPAASAQIKVFQVVNGDASDLVLVLRSLFPEATTGSTVPQIATAEGETSLIPVRFSVEVRTNTIIATGTSGDLDIIEALLLRLDQAESQERINQVYRLKNSPATDVAQAVNDFLRSERIVSQAAPGRQNPFQQIEQEVIVVPEPVRNSLIISATRRYFDQILELVEELDDQPPQVMIQVILAEVDLNNFHEFGVELGLQDSLLFDRSLLGDLVTTTVTSSTSTPGGVVTTTADNIVAATNSPGFDFNNFPLGNSGSTNALASSGNVAGQALSHFSLGRVNSNLGYGGLVLSASSENVSVLLRALDETGSMEVLSRPQIMTLDNQQAFIQVGQRVPRIVNSQLTQLGQINSLALEDVGLLLGVTPRISPDGNVVMEIDAEKSEVGPEREGIPISVSAEGEIIRSPRVNVATAQTTVSAASGQTIVIGGLITTSTVSFSRRVPWLGDLPLVGDLFRYDSDSNRRKELLIILTPHVILGQSEAEYLKQVEMARMSWISSDVFNWIEPGIEASRPLNENDVPVIYPDEVPHTAPETELVPVPEFQKGAQLVPANQDSEIEQSAGRGSQAFSGIVQVTHFDKQIPESQRATSSNLYLSDRQLEKENSKATSFRQRNSRWPWMAK